MSKKKFITTPIYYVNDKPHIGHAYTTVAADVLSRYYKAKGEEVFFLTGTDEHGAKVAEAAKKAGKDPQEFVDELVPKYKTAWKNLNIEYDQFIRTTNPEHEKIVQEFILKLKENGYVEKKKYEGLYCVGCERFMQEDELVDGKCPDHGTKPKLQSEENYFFLLSKAAKDFDLVNLIKSDKFKIGPKSRKNEVLGKIDNGLEDVSISRTAVEWGIGFPGDKDQTIYVWIDALINYWSAPIIYSIKNEKLKMKNDGESTISNSETSEPTTCQWPPDIQLMAKDILWFHAVIWPAMLLASGEKELPKLVFAHGFFTVDGKKMSKTVGNVLDPNDLVKKFGGGSVGADAVRYALLREFPFGEDGDISEEKIAVRYQSDLGNGLGNLLNRTISMMNKFQVTVDNIDDDFSPKDPSDMTELAGGDIEKVKSNAKHSVDLYHRYIEELGFDGCLARINYIVSDLDKYLGATEPWKIVNVNKNKCSEILLNVYRGLIFIQPLIAPFMPKTAEKMKDQLKTLKPEPLFPRLDN